MGPRASVLAQKYLQGYHRRIGFSRCSKILSAAKFPTSHCVMAQQGEAVPRYALTMTNLGTCLICEMLREMAAVDWQER